MVQDLEALAHGQIERRPPRLHAQVSFRQACVKPEADGRWVHGSQERTHAQPRPHPSPEDLAPLRKRIDTWRTTRPSCGQASALLENCHPLLRRPRAASG